MYLVTSEYLAVLACALLVYYLCPRRFRWAVLLAASAVVYLRAAVPFTAIYLLITIVSVWAGGVYFENHRAREDAAKNRRILILIILVNAGILTALKYTNFFLRNFSVLVRAVHSSNADYHVSWIASLGVSFYTLQALSYLLDTYWGTSQAEKNPGKVALFVAWFPQMFSGPVSRYAQIGGQLCEAHDFSLDRLQSGAQRILIGFVKKLVLAENIGIIVSAILDGEAPYGGWMIWIGMSLYLIQLYADFSGCMDIVLGSAECFGIYMPENFDRPFHSQSIQEFWKRWHITLGAWAQDYIMYPILRSGLWKKLRKALKQRFGKEASRTVPSYIAMLVLWLFMGLWHGGDWKYVMEMVWFWLVIMLGQIFADPLQGLKDRLHIGDTPLWRGFCSVRTALIFGLGVTVFRADNVLQGFSRIRSAFSPGALHPAVFSTMAARFTASFSQEELRRIIISALVGMVIFAVQILLRRRDRLLRSALAALPLPLRWLAWYILLFAVLLMGVYGPGFEASAFIYGGF